jgi:DNA repair protein RadC
MPPPPGSRSPVPRSLRPDAALADVDDRCLVQHLVGPAARAVAGIEVASLLEARPEELQAWGLPPSARRRLLAAAELARRFQPAASVPPSFRSPRDLLPLLAPIRSAPREVLGLVALDARLGPLGGFRRVAEGAIAHVSVEAREVFRPALEVGAAAIVIAHNHPSGVPEPSVEDLRFTRTMREAGTLLGVPVLDHVVVARRGYVSLCEAGLIT